VTQLGKARPSGTKSRTTTAVVVSNEPVITNVPIAAAGTLSAATIASAAQSVVVCKFVTRPIMLYLHLESPPLRFCNECSR